MNEKDFIEKQSILIDRLLSDRAKDSKNSKLKDCFIAFLVAAVVSIFLIGYWSADYEYDYVGSNNTVTDNSNLNVGGE